MSRRARHLVAAGLAALSLAAVTGCTSKAPAAVAPKVALFGVDGNMSTNFGKDVIPAEDIFGMAGTAPLTPLPQTFRDRLTALDSEIADPDYAAESYDAVIITALAADLAGSTDGKTIAKYVNGVTTAEDGADTCTSYKECLGDYNAGKDVAYRGLAIRSGLTDN